jgi:hypothetical protein
MAAQRPSIFACLTSVRNASLPSPALRECCHGGLARRGISVCRPAVAVIAEGDRLTGPGKDNVRKARWSVRLAIHRRLPASPARSNEISSGLSTNDYTNASPFDGGLRLLAV